MGNSHASALLPEDARLILVNAARTPVPDYDPLARIKAIEKATDRVKAMYPHLFTHDEPS